MACVQSESRILDDDEAAVGQTDCLTAFANEPHAVWAVGAHHFECNPIAEVPVHRTIHNTHPADANDRLEDVPLVKHGSGSGKTENGTVFCHIRDVAQVSTHP